MWQLNNRTSYAAARNWTRDKGGAHQWLVAVKATFDVAPDGRIKLADEQPLPSLVPEYRGDPAASSLRYESDLLALKTQTDVLVDACAHAAKQRPTATVPVSLRFGDVEKTLLVHGTRVYYRGAMGITTTSPRPFVSRPIHYEWAFGGSDTRDADVRKQGLDARNPVGRGFALDTRDLENQPAHAIEYPRGNPARVGPAGFGPIASFWSPRRERAGTYDARWEKTKKPLLADDYDERFALSAPDDQRNPKPLRGGESVTVVNVTPEGVLRFDLPKIFLAFQTRFGRRAEDHRASLSTVFIDTEKMRLSLVWQSALPVGPREIDYLDQTIIREKAYVT